MVNGDVVIDWTAPLSNGTPITGYNIYIKQSDLVFSEELIDCDGSNSDIISSTQCTVPLSSLITSPYSLALGNDIFARLIV